MSGGGTLTTFLLYIVAVLGIAVAANRLLQQRNFLSEYFLGSRNLGVWAFALTFAATSASGGSFTGFPSKIYTHGWTLALWIGSYMVVPICMMGLIGKRLNQIGRISGAITVPDVFRDRFESPRFGLLTTALLVFFMSFNLVAQFKAGSLILGTLLADVDAFHAVSAVVGASLVPHGVEATYFTCVITFGIVVVLYTTFGGFRAVVWTDVLQGVVMVAGVLVVLPLALHQVGGLESATRELSEMTPPRTGTVTIVSNVRSTAPVRVGQGTWAWGEEGQLFRIARSASVAPGDRADLPVVEITATSQIQRVAADHSATWLAQELRLIDPRVEGYAYGDGVAGAYVSAPGPSRTDPDGFLPLSLAFSFFIMWAIAGTGQPSHYVRLMAFRDARTLRFSIATVTVYYSLIYFPLVIIFCCARILLPGMEAESDRIMPATVIFLTENAGLSWLGGLVIAAPFAAVMSTVDSFLLMISSSLVRDVYQRNLNPQARESTIRSLSYGVTLFVGAGAMAGAVDPPEFLQDIIVFTGSGLAACFLAPTVFALYWPRASGTGCMVGMLSGFGTHLAMYAAGIVVNDSFFRPVRVFDLDPIILGLLVSFLVTAVTIRLTAPPPVQIVKKFFHQPE
ncbi:MAG: hypothetical protein VX733_15090 [Candidatus Latescibacterota bacterium]|nr:hypothetical protein [Candidatus Latescibacterota bacterium]